jgi:hypothetical protein
VGEKPEQERQGAAEEEAGDDGEVKSGVFAAMNDIAGEAAEAEREFSAEIEKSANEDEKAAEEEECAAEFAKRIHPGILPETAEKLSRLDFGNISITILTNR